MIVNLYSSSLSYATDLIFNAILKPDPKGA